MHHPDPFAAYSAKDAEGRFSPQRCNDLVDVIAAEIVDLTGCDMRTARRGASGFMNFRGDRWGYGLGGVEIGNLTALRMLEQWIEAKTAGAIQVAA